ncbi:ATP-dependent deoxyribonuclease, subunit A [Lactobacillus selangorensis]|uniref:DNA 3'-5' helicase n=1 Tax=Lactobacillus selangorensis TaxID=81857 RepID=A0A0R2FUP0_9LACO|nr:ATP-dependent deoxyribonuclease, subunit A [Lactobacillus selangorensis]KRN32636.1 ATP-dependent deoxyribonuclease, subunit A [Lactobacillus selangorensis]
MLVAAAAGSGKTQVLVERIIREIAPQKNPSQQINIDQLLVVTFTNAAAKEMREKIQQKIHEQINQTKGDAHRHWVEQLNRLAVADITTMDAFSLKFVRQNAYLLPQVDPGFRVLADDTERTLLRLEAWQQLCEKRYADAEFQTLSNNFSNDRDDNGLQEAVAKVYTMADVHPDSKAWLDKLPDSYLIDKEHFDDSVFATESRAAAAQKLGAAADLAKAALKTDIAQSEDHQHLKAVLEADQKTLTDLQALFMHSKKWSELRAELLDIEYGKLTSKLEVDGVKISKDISLDKKEDPRSAYKKIVADLQMSLFAYPEAQVIALTAKAHHLVEGLVKVVQQFAKQYQTLKTQRRVADYSDIEHDAVQLLEVPTSNLLAMTQAHYKEVLVDEYQDTNQLQEQLLHLIATTKAENHLFMVGDDKQSIYGFRLAEPGLFQGKRRNFWEWQPGQEPDQEAALYPQQPNKNVSEVVALDDNFRATKENDQFVNMLFGQLMSTDLGGGDYLKQGQLHYGAKWFDERYAATTDKPILSSEPEIDLFANDKSNDAVDNVDRYKAEAYLVAKQIKLWMGKLPDSTRHQIWDSEQKTYRDLKYEDITLLTRTKSNNVAIMEIFKQMGIPISVADAPNFFKTTEVQVMMSLLTIIDNPDQDIPLVAVLRSPMYGLTSDELASIRLEDRKASFYTALTAFVAHHQGESSELMDKLSRFTVDLSTFRDLAIQNQLVTLIWTIYNRTGYLDYVGGMPGGAQRQANLHALYQRANDYEQTSFKGLFQFIKFIQKMQDQDNDLTAAATVSDEDVVKLMTIHGSKGLQFPVVFVMNLTKGLNTWDTSADVLLNDQGKGIHIGIDYVDPKYNIKLETPQKMLLQDSIHAKNWAEEMRVLYVALTRSEQKLVLVGAVNNDDDETLAHWQGQDTGHQPVLPLQLRQNAKTYFDWIIPALMRQKDFPRADDAAPVQAIDGLPTAAFTFRTFDAENLNLDKDGQWDYERGHNAEQLDQRAAAVQPDQVADYDQIRCLLEDDYPDSKLASNPTITPAYQSVSDFKALGNGNPGDPTDNEMADGSDSYQHVNERFDEPAFTLGDDSNGASATEIGTATHLLFKQIPLQDQAPTPTEFETLLQTDVAQDLITTAAGKQIDLASVAAFYQQEPIHAALWGGTQPHRVEREYSFSMLRPDRGAHNAPVLIHGTIDGFIELADKIILFDYKTDRIKPDESRADYTAEMWQRYGGQLGLYKEALTSLLHNGKPIEEYLYFVAAQQLSPLPQELRSL